MRFYCRNGLFALSLTMFWIFFRIEIWKNFLIKLPRRSFPRASFESWPKRERVFWPAHNMIRLSWCAIFVEFRNKDTVIELWDRSLFYFIALGRKFFTWTSLLLRLWVYLSIDTMTIVAQSATGLERLPAEICSIDGFLRIWCALGMSFWSFINRVVIIMQLLCG